ncbi:MAG: hypothetical protein Kow0025_12200 [Thermodesulfovibrionales bacterium]
MARRGEERRLRAELDKNLRLFYFENGEVADILASTEEFPAEARRKVLSLCVSFSGVSGSIVPKILRYAREAAAALPPADLRRWVDRAFALLDSKGIEAAVSFLSRTGREELYAFSHPGGLDLEAVGPRLETYIRGLSGKDLPVRPAEDCHTDTAAVYLPHVVNAFGDPGENFLLYKLMASYMWAQTACGTFHPARDGKAVDIAEFMDGFGERRLALDLYGILEAGRIEAFLRGQLPGLMAQAGGVNGALLAERPALAGLNPRTAFVEAFYRRFLSDGREPLPSGVKRAAALYGRGERPDARLFAEIYEKAAARRGEYLPVGPIPYLGVIRPGEASLALSARKRRLRDALASLLSLPEYEPPERPPGEGAPPEGRAPRADRQYLLIKGRLVELDEELRALLEEEGAIPGAVLVDGAEAGGRYYAVELAEVQDEGELEEAPAEGGIRYDEWDHKRGDYRRRWCTLYEYDVHPSLEPFVEITLRRYRGYVNTLRKRFELLRREPRVAKRQPEGDGIDIDATVEALADVHAGLSPRENFFTRYERLERSIAVLFLLDMSGSTKGWINQSEKEALVLMCEALEALGDRYAIYGFSGMTRNRAEFYRVKSFGEPYAEEVKRRIAGIAPKDYTRMGPAIRHATGILAAEEARVRLLVTLSDGKPEDYDAYKGDRGIEDTRAALAEARHRSIHPFCITIDREASSYLPHMFGEASYIFIDDVRKLPARITEIYRKLTT